MLSQSGDSPIFQVRWTEDILAEALYRLRKDHPKWSGANISSMRDHIVEAFPHGRISAFAADENFTGRDEHDGHVHAAAIAGNVDILLTCNDPRDFVSPEVDLDELSYEIYGPDDFFVLVDDSDSRLVRRVTRSQRDYWFKRNRSADLPEYLMKADAPQFAERVRCHLLALDGR